MSKHPAWCMLFAHAAAQRLDLHVRLEASGPLSVGEIAERHADSIRESASRAADAICGNLFDEQPAKGGK